MEKNKRNGTRISYLNKGKVKGIGFFEGIGLKIRGRIDGSRNLPRECDDGHWCSPHLDREVRSYDEFSDTMFGQLQFEKQDVYERLGTLMDSLALTKSQLASAEDDLAAALSMESGVNASRKHGESKLTDAQVAARRANERDKRLAPLRRRVSELQSKLAAESDEFSSLRNKIIEDNNSVRMICFRVRDHLLQRMDVYWNSAMLTHSENARMPVVPSIEVASRAEEIYMESHQALMQRAELLSQSLSKEEKEAA